MSQFAIDTFNALVVDAGYTESLKVANETLIAATQVQMKLMFIYY